MIAQLSAPFEPASLLEEETLSAKELSRNLTGLLNGGERLTLHLTNQTGQSLETTINTSAIKLLARILTTLAEGHKVALIPMESELTTQEAAEIMGVSRPYVVGLLEKGNIPFRKIGTHRRIKLQDLMEFSKRNQEARQKGVQELTEHNEALGLYRDF